MNKADKPIVISNLNKLPIGSLYGILVDSETRVVIEDGRISDIVTEEL